MGSCKVPAKKDSLAAAKLTQSIVVELTQSSGSYSSKTLH